MNNGPKFFWGLGKLLFKCAIKGGIVMESATGIEFRRLYPFLDIFFSQIQALQPDVLPGSGAHIGFKQSV